MEAAEVQRIVSEIERVNTWTRGTWAPNRAAAHTFVENMMASGRYAGNWVCAIAYDGTAHGFVGDRTYMIETVPKIERRLEETKGHGNYALLTRWIV